MEPQSYIAILLLEFEANLKGSIIDDHRHQTHYHFLPTLFGICYWFLSTEY